MLAFIYIRKIRVGCISEKNHEKFLTLYRNEKNRMFFQPLYNKLVMLLIIKRLKDEALMMRKDSDIDTIKDTIKFIQLLVTSLKSTRYYCR